MNTDDEALQADYTRDFLILAFSHPAVVGVQVWGFWEKTHWRPRAAMYRADWTEKPNGRAYRSLVLDQWRTRSDGDDRCRRDAARPAASMATMWRRSKIPGRRVLQAFSLARPGPAPVVVVTPPAP